MRHAQLIMGPAGSGKSTYVDTIRLHCEATRRTVHCINLDPAADAFKYPVSIDVRDLITVDDVMEELDFGPNGGLVYCFEYLMKNLDWLLDQVGEYDNDYLLIDCPGQIELYAHHNSVRSLTQSLQRAGYQVAGVYLIDVSFVSDVSKYIAGSLMCLSTMINLAIPFINVLSKMDLLDAEQRRVVDEQYLDTDADSILGRLNAGTDTKLYALNESISTLLEEYGLVSFLTLDRSEPHSVARVLAYIDNAIQYGEDLDFDNPEESREVDE